MTKNVLLAVVKDSRDLRLILKNRLYRIPAAQAPKRKADYIAFYQPSSAKEHLGLFRVKPKGFDGLIRYWAKIKRQEVLPRMKIIADEPGHPRARQDYRLIELKNVKKLKRPIANKRRMRVTFGFTSLDKLKSAREVKELFDVPPLEETMEQILKDIGITYRREYIVKAASKKHYRLDFALIPRDKHPAAFSRQVKPVGIECDGNKAHNRPEQKLKDRQKDSDLQALGWKILRFCEQEILKKPGLCRKKIETMLK